MYTQCTSLKRGNTVKKNIKFTYSVIVAVQEYADLHYGGNFTLAANKLISKGLLTTSNKKELP
tara:strand:+ start:228 stop:416 length:189 start_codon:yes stop_codon:yes gene_type:complete